MQGFSYFFSPSCLWWLESKWNVFGDEENGFLSAGTGVGSEDFNLFFVFLSLFSVALPVCVSVHLARASRRTSRSSGWQAGGPAGLNPIDLRENSWGLCQTPRTTVANGWNGLTHDKVASAEEKATRWGQISHTSASRPRPESFRRI